MKTNIIALVLFFTGSVLAMVAVVGLGGDVQKTEASPSYLTYEVTSVATTSPAYQQFGTATTTLSMATNDVDAISLKMMVTASSSETQWKVYREESENNVDWY